MGPTAAERRKLLSRIGWRALIGFATPPVVVAVGIWSIGALSGMQRPEIRGLFAHLTGGYVPVVVEAIRLADEPIVDRLWFESTTATLGELGFRADGDRVVKRGAYRGWLRFFLGQDSSIGVFAQQTTYPGAPAPSIAYVSACSPPATTDPVAGATRWVETSDEWAPEGDTGYPPFLRVELFPGLDFEALRLRHSQHTDRICGAAPLLALTTEALVVSIETDRRWWFDWCAQSLVGMTADCKGEEEQPP